MRQTHKANIIRGKYTNIYDEKPFDGHSIQSTLSGVSHQQFWYILLKNKIKYLFVKIIKSVSTNLGSVIDLSFL